MGFKYGLGVVNGTGAKPDNNKFKDVYLTLSQTIGAGDGQSAGQRIGAFVYYGKQPMIARSTRSAHAAAVSPTGEYDGGDNKALLPLRRLGEPQLEDVQSRRHVHARSRRQGVQRASIPTKDYEYDGGFVELDYAGLWNNRLVASALYNWVAPPTYDDEKRQDHRVLGARCATTSATGAR